MAVRADKVRPRLDLKFAAEIIVSLKIRFCQQSLDKGMAVRVRLSPLSGVTADELRRAVAKVAALAEIGPVRLEIAQRESGEDGQFRIDSMEPLGEE